MDMLQAIRAFSRVASVGSFTAAAQELNLVTSQVSRAIADLETHLQVRLLQRTTRRVALTQAGERYLSHCDVILNQLAQAEAEASEVGAEPAGTLRIGVSASFDRYHLSGLLSSYLERFPQVSASVTLLPQMQDALPGDYDVVLLCSSEPPGPGIVSERLGAVSSILCAAPVYLARYGVPKTPCDLKQHRCFDHAGDVSSGQWQFEGPFGHETCSVGDPILHSDLSDVLADAIEAGLGIGPLPLRAGMQKLQAGTMMHVLPRYRMQARNAYVLLSSPRSHDKKVSTWVEFLKETLPQRLVRDEAAFTPHLAPASGDEAMAAHDVQKRGNQDT
ncbi:DNA-binding transcriptional LysR family regulator [Paraburkholderia sp. BL6665CI2N2]|uniref:LysR family transcriptional regulator n=1 Tax=Paraburkholderia sp. BL6665CI2N2 TaxID=1938806 RepID=UPI001065A815|nr:LysR family transcriptional regulator [Paraburkholderia sp. BL6665CI2N2]TDY19893.1 DNA-binding transcriptional LysR family regulator [Paraburkholderia sp. BL6665CI2N2]